MDLAILAKNYEDALSVKRDKQKVVDKAKADLQTAQNELTDSENAVRSAYSQMKAEADKGMSELSTQELRNVVVGGGSQK